MTEHARPRCARCATRSRPPTPRAVRARSRCPAGTYTLTIEPTGTAFDPTQGDLDIINDAKVTIKGAGQASTIVDANEIDRAFTVDDGAGLSLSDLTIANGRSGTDTGGECGTCGGGVWSQGALALSNVTVTASDGGTAGGAIFSGDDAGSTLSVTDSTFTFDNADLGGALATGPSASTTISGSTFSSNVGFEQGGALQNEEGSLSIDSSTFSDNVSGQSGGAIEELTELAADGHQQFVHGQQHDLGFRRDRRHRQLGFDVDRQPLRRQFGRERRRARRPRGGRDRDAQR